MVKQFYLTYRWDPKLYFNSELDYLSNIQRTCKAVLTPCRDAIGIFYRPNRRSKIYIY